MSTKRVKSRLLTHIGLLFFLIILPLSIIIKIVCKNNKERVICTDRKIISENR